MRLSRLADRDVAAGLVFAAIGVAGLWIGRRLNVGTASEMGEGFFPLLMCGLLVALGIAIVAAALARAPVPLPRLTWRPLVFVTAAALAFMASLEPLGVVVAVAATVVIANWSGRPLGPRPLAVLAAALALGVLSVFVWGLGLPIRALPRGWL